MLFITDRLPKQGIKSEVGRDFDFDLNNNCGGNSVFFCEKKGEDIYKEIGRDSFLSNLKNTSYKQILIYIHGFSNLPKDVFKAAEEFQKLCDMKKENEVLVVPLIWPCDNDLGIVKDYWDDQRSADHSAFAFSRVLEKFIKWRDSDENQENPCLKRINVLAHSMGNRVLRETLLNWNKYALSDGIPLIFRNTFLIAADIVNESLHKGKPGELICHSSRNVSVYYASDDLALRGSKISNLRNKVASRRLGHTGPEDTRLTPSNVYSIDCDEVNNLYDLKGHTYFRSGKKKGTPGKVFEHIFSTLISGRVFVDDTSKKRHIIK